MKMFALALAIAFAVIGGMVHVAYAEPGGWISSGRQSGSGDKGP